MKRQYYQVLINGKERAKVYYEQTKKVVRIHIEYKDKHCNIELVKVEFEDNN